MERLNARYLPPDALPERCDLAVVDVSFISLAKVVPALLPHLKPGSLLLPLVKPQFEAGRGQVGKGGILRDEAVRGEVIAGCVAELVELAGGRLALAGLFDSPVAGVGGNREAFALLRVAG
jgi:23S rRNA (cytidine1920-2'-O)/16S rRNA (cytidine1409-2'-O)-methyltransferase